MSAPMHIGPPESPIIDSPEYLALIGPESWKRPLLKILAGLPIEKRWLGASPMPTSELRGARSAIVVSMDDHLSTEIVQLAREALGSRPVAAIVPLPDSRTQSMQMYDAGATLLVAWPEEAFLMRPLLEILLAEGKDDASRSTTTRLQENVRLRVELQFDPSEVDVDEVTGPTVKLSGFVPTMLSKMELVSLVEQTPGVRNVNAEDVMVRAENTTAIDLTNEVRLALRLNHRVDASAVAAVANDDGRVIVAGMLAHEGEQRLVRRIVASISGVKDLVDLTTRQ